MIGGAYLCYEGFEKIAHKVMHRAEEDEAHHEQLVVALADPATDIVAFEKEKVRGAVRTDFILSAEIIVIALGTVAGAPFAKQVTVLAGIAILMTVGVYGLVAGIVKLDDAGLYLSTRQGDDALARLLRGLGRAVLVAAPALMKTLSVVGTAAMFLVGGGILVHGIPGGEALIHGLAAPTGPVLEGATSMAANALVGVAAGAIALAVVTPFLRKAPH
jgi:predicted DNA repair protein MutK